MNDSAEKPLSQNQAIISATRILALGNVASKTLGLARDTVISNLFGAYLGSAYEAAVLIPNILFDMIRGGMVDAALVPVFSDLANAENRDKLWGAVSAFLSVAIIFLIGMVLIVELFYKQFASFAGIYGFNDPALTDISLRLFQIAMPALIFMCIASILTAVLYSLKRFTVPAFLPAVFNGSIVVFALLRREHLSSLVFGLLLGSFLQICVQLPMLRDAKLRLNLDIKHPIIRPILKLYLPVAGGLILNMIVLSLSYNLATRTGDSDLSYMRRATTLMQFPIGLIVTATSVAILPTLSQQALGDLKAFKSTFSAGIRLVGVLILPATMGLFALALPIVGLLFGHGEYTAYDVEQTALVLQVYLIGLPFAAIDQMLIFGAYARKDTLRPAIVGVISMTIYSIVAVLTFPTLGILCLMVADAVKHISHTLMMLVVMRGHIGRLSNYNIAPTLLKALVAALITGAVAYGLQQLLNTRVSGGLGEVVTVVVPSLAGVLTYAALSFLFDISEAKALLQRRKPL